MVDSMTKNDLKYKSFIILQCIIWGFGNPITKYVYDSMTPFCYMAVRFIIAAVLFVVFFKKQIINDWEWIKIRNCTVIGIFMAATYIFANLALKDSMVTIAGFLMGISVVFTSIISIILGKKLKRSYIAILVMVIVGMYMLCCGGNGSFSFGIGEFYALMSALCMAITLMLSADLVKEVNPATLSTIQCVVTAVACVIFGLIFEDFSCILTDNLMAWISLLYLSLGCTVAAFLLQNISIKHISPVFASLAFCMEPIFTAIFSYFLLGEVITIVGIIGSVFVMISVVVASIINES